MPSSIPAQRARQLIALKRGPVNAPLAHRELDINYRGHHVLDLRRQSHCIVTEFDQVKRPHGWAALGRYKLESA